MKATYVDDADVMGITDDKFKITVAEEDLEQMKQERAKLYLEAKSATGTPRFYWFSDAQDPLDVPVGSPADFDRIAGEDEDLFTLTVNIGDKLSEHPS